MRAGSALTPLASTALRDAGGSLIIFCEATERRGEGQVKTKRMKMRWGSRVERRPREADMTSHASSSLRGDFWPIAPFCIAGAYRFISANVFLISQHKRLHLLSSDILSCFKPHHSSHPNIASSPGWISQKQSKFLREMMKQEIIFFIRVWSIFCLHCDSNFVTVRPVWHILHSSLSVFFNFFVCVCVSVCIFQLSSIHSYYCIFFILYLNQHKKKD